MQDSAGLGASLEICETINFPCASITDSESLSELVDSYVSVALGRKPFMTEQDCRPDLLPLTEEEDAILRSPTAQPHPLAFFNEGIKLHHIVYCALHKVYPLVGSEHFNVSLLQELDERLLAWHEQLPGFLQPEGQSPASREASYIQLRFADPTIQSK